MMSIATDVAKILADVAERGMEAADEYSLRFDGESSRVIPPEEAEAALAGLPERLRAALERAKAAIEDYQSRLVPQSRLWQTPHGGQAGYIVRPMRRVGLYVPGGLAAYPSSVLMSAVPARIAGVGEIIVTTPPGRLNNAVLAACALAGVDKIIAVGGAQALAVLAYVEKVDFIAGPGNAFVTEAKRQLYGVVGVDMLAGPSEIVVIADASARPEWVAADLDAQAEHGHKALTTLLTDSTELALAVDELTHSRAARVKLCGSLEDACRRANELAPEHLELMTENPEALLPLIHCAGAVFLGCHSPEALGDYIAGPSHVLPTSAAARFASPLSAETFTKKISVIDYPPEALRAVCEDIAVIAEAEGLPDHARSAAVRFEAADESAR
jgi:histidinol dehydrogenase